MRGRPTEKNGRKTCFYLDKEEIEQLEILSAREGLSKSTHIGLLIRQRYREASIGGFIKGLNEELEKIQQQRRKIEQEEKNIRERLRIAAEAITIKEHQARLDKELEEDKKRYVNILIRKIIDGDPAKELQRMASSHSALLNHRWGPEELLREAYSTISERREEKNGL